jgi:HEAT repeat protein
MYTQAYTRFAIELLLAMTKLNGKQDLFSIQNDQLYINGKLNDNACLTGSELMQAVKAKYLLAKMGLIGADLNALGKFWRESLHNASLTGAQLQALGLQTITLLVHSNDSLGQWRRTFEARLRQYNPYFDYIEYQLEGDHDALILYPLLNAWPERLLNDPNWACAESPLPEVPPLPLDQVWVDLYVSEPLDENYQDDQLFAHAIEQRYQKSQWSQLSADFVLESLRSTVVLVGAPGIGKTTLMKWFARRLIQNPEGRFLLPLFVPLRAYALAKTQHPMLELLSFALEFCGVETPQQIEKWETILSYLSGTGRNTVLILLDGWDEVPQDKRETLLNEIKKLEYSFSLIITSRPSGYPRALTSTQLYEITDLPPDSIAKLILRWHSVMGQASQADRLLNHLKCYPDLAQLARNPFLLNLLCAINIQDILHKGLLPRNRTELYSQTLEYIYSYQTNKYPAHPFDRQCISHTRAFALWLLAEVPNYPQYLFGAQDVVQATGNCELLPQVLRPSRLINQWHIDKESLYFLHTSFQEYLAAEALLADTNQAKRVALIQQELYSPAWQEILRFLAGQIPDQTHDFWQLIRQLATEADLCGMLDIKLANLIAETGAKDGGKALLGIDLRERLWEHIKQGIAPAYFERAYIQLDAEHYAYRVNDASDLQSNPLRARLIRSLKQNYSRASSQTLLAIVLADNQQEAAIASYNLKNILDHEGLNTLKLAITDKTRCIENRQMLIRTLGYSQDYGAISLLVALYNNTPYLREAIAKALADIGGWESVAELVNFLQNTNDDQEKQELINALGRARNLPARDALLMELVRLSPDDPLVEDILLALYELPISQYSDIISLYTEANFSEMRRIQAIEVLAEASETQVMDTLVGLAQADRVERVRIAALVALKKRARSDDFEWLAIRVKDKTYGDLERTMALEAIYTLYNHFRHAQFFSINYHYIYEQVFALSLISLKDAMPDLNRIAATECYVLGYDIAPSLLEICTNEALFGEATLEAACISLGKIKYKAALPLLLKWIEREPNVEDDEERPLTQKNQRLAMAAAQAYIQIDLSAAIKHPSQTVRVLIKKFALENGYLLFTDRIITPSGKLLLASQPQAKPIPEEWKLNADLEAFQQMDKLRWLCQYLLDEQQACMISKYPTKKPIPLFKKSPQTLNEGIDYKTGKKLLAGGIISKQAAQTLMKRLKHYFAFVMAD